MFKGQNLRALRQDKDWTQEELANKAGVQRSQISLWETDKITPDLDTAHKLSTALGCSMDLFFGDLVSYLKHDSTPATA